MYVYLPLNLLSIYLRLSPCFTPPPPPKIIANPTKSAQIFEINKMVLFTTNIFALVLTPKAMCCLTQVYHGGGADSPPPKDLSPYSTFEHETLHACSIWPKFLEYNIKVKFCCLKLPKFNGLNQFGLKIVLNL